MELHVIEREGRETVVLLDNEMRIVKPVYDYLKFQRQKDKALNTLKASGSDLRTYWEFLNDSGYEYDKVTPKTRDLYVPMSLIKELDDFIMEERNLIDTDHSYIFVSEQKRQLGKQLTYRAAYDKLKKVQEEIGVDFNFHDLRHTFCSNLVQSGMDVSVVRMIMGHEHLSTTQKYTHLSNPYIEDSLSRYWNQSTLIGGGSDGK